MISLPLVHSKQSVDETYAKTLEYLHANPDLQKRIEDLYWTLHFVWDIIPQTKETMFARHIFPAMEASNEFDVSSELALEGFYRQAVVSLRSVLELGLLSVFFNRAEDGHIKVEKWASSRVATPFMSDIKNQLQELKHFPMYEAKFELSKNITQVYAELNNYTHTRGIKYTSRGVSLKSNVNHFDAKTLNDWVDMSTKIIKLIIVVHALRYPLLIKSLPLEEKFGIDQPGGYFLPDDQLVYMRKMLSEEELKHMDQLVETDAFSQEIIADVMSRPDMSEDELLNQRIKLSQSWIETIPGGYEAWFRSQDNIYKKLDKKVYAQFLDDATILKTWATENNYLNESDADRFMKRHGLEIEF